MTLVLLAAVVSPTGLLSAAAVFPAGLLLAAAVSLTGLLSAAAVFPAGLLLAAAVSPTGLALEARELFGIIGRVP